MDSEGEQSMMADRGALLDRSATAARPDWRDASDHAREIFAAE